MEKVNVLHQDTTDTAIKWQLVLVLFAVVMAFGSCCDDSLSGPTPTPTQNKASMITDKDKLAMLYSMVDLEGDKGRIYEINYTVDYMLDKALDFNIDCTDKLTADSTSKCKYTKSFHKSTLLVLRN